MSAPPLDLDGLRKTAEAATPGPWTARGYRVETVPEFDLHRFDVMGEMVADCDLLETDAAHIAAFDPPTALALLDRLHTAEAKVVAVRELASPDWCLSVPASVKAAITARLGGGA